MIKKDVHETSNLVNVCIYVAHEILRMKESKVIKLLSIIGALAKLKRLVESSFVAIKLDMIVYRMRANNFYVYQIVLRNGAFKRILPKSIFGFSFVYRHGSDC